MFVFSQLSLPRRERIKRWQYIRPSTMLNVKRKTGEWGRKKLKLLRSRSSLHSVGYVIKCALYSRVRLSYCVLCTHVLSSGNVLLSVFNWTLQLFEMAIKQCPVCSGLSSRQPRINWELIEWELFQFWSNVSLELK